MTDESSSSQNPLAIPEEFFTMVKQALENLYDLPYLHTHPLAKDEETAQPSSQEPSRQAPGHRLRKEIIDAIEMLNPGKNVFFRQPQARIYHLMHMHYVAGMMVQEAASELGISRRQAYRDLHEGEISVAILLWEKRRARTEQKPEHETQAEAVRQEITRIAPNVRVQEFNLIVENAMKTVDKLAKQRGLDIQLHLPLQRVLVTVDSSIAQQALVGIFSRTLQNVPAPGWIQIQTKAGAEAVRMEVLSSSQAKIDRFDPLINELFDRLGWAVDQPVDSPSAMAFALNIPRSPLTLLIIDDNLNLVQLIERYLANYSFHLLMAPTAERAYRLLEEFTPSGILLDVMMPDIDGWEILQRIRSKPALQNVPVVICSVFNDPELAYSLGATVFLPKPFNQEGLLSALSKSGLL